MLALRGRAVLTVASAVIVVGGCSASAEEPTLATGTTPKTSAASSRQVDLSRVGEIAGSFPVGYAPNPPAGPTKLDPKVDKAADFVSWGKPLTVQPDDCRSLLKPVTPSTGAEFASITSVKGATEPFVGVYVYDPVSEASPIPDSGCDHFTFEAEGALPDGRVDRLGAPTFEAATSYAIKTAFTPDASAVEVPLVEYFYVAILAGRTFVKLWARVPADFNAEPALPELLIRTVAVLRGG